MSLVIRRDPISELNREFNRFFNQALSGVPRFFSNAEEGLVNGSWNPTVDVYEDKNGIILEADLPGMKAGDFELSVENNILTLRGERKFEKKSEEGNYHRVERSYGQFTRSFTLPSTIDIEQVNAEFKDGVLRVTLPRREETKPRQIQVQIKTEADANKAKTADAK
ncbi:MAG TPA: Hsp20/alpha crystallin family protein [Blastocatellia bacterium]|nr:Hsp20/alpha crystallin family protein [Blastocatellia bacterium]